MATSEEEHDVDLSKMKVADLKRELKSRGLSTVGNKTELIERLQAGMNGNQDLILDDTGTLESEILDEDEVLGDGLDDVELTSEADGVLDEVPKTSKQQPLGMSSTNLKRKASSPEKSDTKPPERLNKKIVLIRNPSLIATKEDSEIPKMTMSSDRDSTDGENKKIIKLSGLSLKERLELRAQKFGSPQSDLSKKEERANRFGTTGQSQSTSPNVNVLLKRAERFGTCVSTVAMKAEQEEKLKARRERFGLSTTANTKPVSNKSLEEKKQLRAERFKIV